MPQLGKTLFDEFLKQRATKAGEAFVPFDIDTDYPRYVDGKPRYDGVADFLVSRGIELPLGTAEDGPEVQSVHALGNLKDRYFLQYLEHEGIEPARAVVVEDAIVGVKAGCAGRFGCVIGVDRRDQTQAMRDAGADVVVTDLGQIQLAVEPSSAWSLVFEDFDPAQEGIREALCALGNGYFATRGATAGAQADDIHYPGTYLAGGYNRLRTDIAGRSVENEDLVNFPNWLALKFRIGGDDWFDVRSVKVLSYRQELDLRSGMLLRSLSFEDGRVTNDGAKLYRKFNNKHLESLAGEVVGEDGVCLLVRTCQSHISVAQAVRTRSFLDGKLLEVRRRVIEEPGYIGQELKVDLKQGETLLIEKLASIYTSRDVE
ncbi:beta-phosphoglucomutase family hydrolase, partial [mine drainage metagenome]